MSKVNTFLIGAQKAGTTSLFDWLVQHPDIYGPISMKDYHFFSNNRFYKKGIDDFEQYFKSKTEKILINGAVNYIYFSDIAAPRIKEYNPESKFIVILRNPIERAFSAYKFFKKNQEENSDSFQDALKKEQDSNFNTHEKMGRFNYVDHGFYAHQLSQFFSNFPKENIKIVLFEELVNNKEEIVKELYQFLGVDSTFLPEFKKLNSTGKPKSKLLNQLVFSDSSLKKTIKKLLMVDQWMGLEMKTKLGYLVRKLNTSNASNNTTVEAIPNELRKELVSLYEEDVNQLSKLLDKDLKAIWQF